MSKLEAVLGRVDAELDKSVERWFDFLRIPSISTDPEYAEDCVRGADWLVEQLEGMGFAASRRDTPGHPMVVAQNHDAGPEAPHVLFYGHYDVQPVDPLELWNTPPFEPQLKEVDGTTQVFARGAADDKGQLLTFIEACRAYLAEGQQLPVRVTMLFEGEEESGSPSLDDFVRLPHTDRSEDRDWPQ